MNLHIIKHLISEYCELVSGAYIENHFETIAISAEFKITKRALKHIIEQRKKMDIVKRKFFLYLRHLFIIQV